MPAVQILWGLAHSRECPDAGYTSSSRSPLSLSPPNSARWKLHYQVTSERHKSGRCYLQFPPRGWLSGICKKPVWTQRWMESGGD